MAPSGRSLAKATSLIAGRWQATPRVGIILGSGAGDPAGRLHSECVIPFSAIPGFARATAIGHAGELVCGTLAGQPVIAMFGRGHLYEGYVPALLRTPVDLLHELGVRVLLVSNAAGGINPQYRSGDLVALHSHIDLMFRPWLSGEPRMMGRNVRSTNRGDLYDRGLIDVAAAIARRGDFPLHRGVYAGMQGPNYETRAEYRFLRQIGADVAGMSTIPEVAAAAEHSMRVFAVSIVANVANPDRLERTSGEEVVAAVSRSVPNLWELFEGLVRRA
jgi:purine-nucleoside phosphorylase